MRVGKIPASLMDKLTRYCAIVSVLLIITTFVSPALGEPSAGDFREIEKTLVEELAETNTPGAAMAIVSGDRIVYAKGFGIANVETNAPVSAGIVFRVGSVTKMLTATVLVTLLQEKNISTDVPIGKVVTGLSGGLQRISTRQLLSMTAGIIDYARICCAQEEPALATTVQSFEDATIFFTEPGKVYSYSNPSYIIAGYMIEQLSGKPYADAMQERLFLPLGMTHTGFRPTMAMTFPLSQGHEGVSEKLTIVRPFVNNVGDWPAGYAYTNIQDLAQFSIAFLNGGKVNGKQMISPAVIAELVTPRTEIPFSWNIPAGFLDSAKYGHGFFIQQHRGVEILHHGGTINGFGSFVVMAPKHRLAVIILANKTGSILGKTVEKSMELFLPVEPKRERQPLQQLSMTPAEIKTYTGVYGNGHLRIELFEKDEKLFRRDFYPATIEEGPGREFEAPVTKIGPHRFVFTAPGDPAPTEFVLLTDHAGNVEYLHSLLQTAKRITAPAR